MLDIKEAIRRLPLPTPLRALPGVGLRLPGVAARALPAAVGAPLCVIAYQQPALHGLSFVLLALVVVRRSPVWLFLVFLACGRLQEDPSPDWRFFTLLFGLHLFGVLQRVAVVAPLRGWAQLAVLRRPLLRFVVIQLAAQPVAALALWLLAPGAHGRLALGFFGVLGGVALLAVTVVLVAPLLKQRASQR